MKKSVKTDEGQPHLKPTGDASKGWQDPDDVNTGNLSNRRLVGCSPLRSDFIGCQGTTDPAPSKKKT
jgi:hypothetical protein